jgi:signal transduction histidine kinase/ActR/RegA family two-component response regulator
MVQLLRCHTHALVPSAPITVPFWIVLHMSMPSSIRSRLLLLVLAVLLPGLGGATWLIANTIDAERTAHERSLRDTARASSMVVDRELAQRAGVARVLAQSRWLDDAPELSTDQLAGFEQLARRALEGLDGWVELRAADRLLLDTRHPLAGAARSHPVELAQVARVLPLQTSSGGDAAHAAVVQPVQRGGGVVLNLLITLVPQELQRIVDAQKLPADWVGTVMDDRGTVIARHPGGKAHIGGGATADLRERMAVASEGLFESVALDGRPAIGYFTKSPQGWASVSAMPSEQFYGLAQRAVLQVTLGTLALLALAVAGALAVSRGIVGPVQMLKAAAARLQSGEPAPTGSTGIAEYDEVTAALADAARAIAHARVELEHRVAEAIARTRQAEQRLSQGQRVEALGRLTGGVAHEFNNLLGIISNSAHLIGRHPVASALDVPLGATRRAVEKANQLTQHLLRFAGRQPVSPGTVELERCLPEVLALIRSVLGRRIELAVEVAPDTAAIWVDAGELELALINLALNACDAMPRGGEIQLAARNATAQDREDFDDLAGVTPGPQVLITVRDNGLGMTTEVAAHVFEPFFTTKPFGLVSGLGLSQVHGFVTQAGGAVRVASTPGVGTAVLMLLPVAADAPAPPGPAGLAPAAPMAGARVLVVDDNDDLAAVTEALLREHGAEVQRARDATEALRLVATQPRFDAVLTDMVMPGGAGGLSLARLLRQRHPALAVVLISGYSPAASAEEFPFLHKPCQPEELLAALGQAIATQARRKAGPGLRAGGTPEGDAPL